MNTMQFSELLPDTFVKVILNNGKHKYGFLLDSNAEQMLIVTDPNYRDDFNAMSFEKLDTNAILSIDPFMK